MVLRNNIQSSKAMVFKTCVETYFQSIQGHEIGLLEFTMVSAIRNSNVRKIYVAIDKYFHGNHTRVLIRSHSLCTIRHTIYICMLSTCIFFPPQAIF